MSYNFLKTTLAMAFFLSAHASLVRAETDADIDQEVAKIEAIQNKDDIWNQQLKEKYSLTDEQIKTLRESGISYPQLAMASQLSKTSQKPLEEVLKMRTEQKMGWGKIAKELGVPPKEIGQSVRDFKHAIRDERKIAQADARADRKEKMGMKREERKERHAKKARK